MIRKLVIVVAIGLTPAAALADEATARKAYDEGERAYNLGQFDKAIELFTKAYEQWPEPAFLFNLAQTYRQMGDCRQAAFFYKRFLSLKENDTKKPLKPELRTEVEKRIAELEKCVKEEIASRPPTGIDSGTPASGTTTTGGTGTTGTTGGTTATTNGKTTGDVSDDGEDDGEEDDGAEDDDGITKRAEGQPTLLSVRLGVGAGKLSAGDLEVPMQFAGSLIAGYPLAIAPKLQLDLGAAFSFTPVPYDTTVESGSGALIGILANVGAAYSVIPKLAVRADVGAGVQLFSGLTKMGNPFTMNGNPASGALSTFMVRAGVSGDYAVTPNVLVTVTPLAFSYSPAPEGFDESISSLTTLSFLAGIAYRR